MYTTALAALPCTACIASGALAETVRELLDGVRRDLYAKRPGRVYRLPPRRRQRRPAA